MDPAELCIGLLCEMLAHTLVHRLGLSGWAALILEHIFGELLKQAVMLVLQRLFGRG